MGINIGLSVFVAQTQNFFDQKEIKKMNFSVFESRQMAERKSFGAWKFDNKFPVAIQDTSDEPYFNGSYVCAVLG